MAHFSQEDEKEDEYPKLVRDFIPDIIEADGFEKPKIEILENDVEFLKQLLQKVVEESKELQLTKEKKHLAEEVADIKELLDEILEIECLNWEIINKVQEEKRKRKGGFKKRILMLKKAEK